MNDILWVEAKGDILKYTFRKKLYCTWKPENNRR